MTDRYEIQGILIILVKWNLANIVYNCTVSVIS